MRIIREGLAKIYTDDVFYNPRMKFCRDLDIILFSVIDGDEYLDALAATGVRGIRAKLEAGLNPIFNDRDVKAVEIIKKNLKLNNMEAEVYNKDASALMYEKKFLHIDIDPFGSPSQFIDAACFSSRKYLSMTATDTAALCGSAVNAGLRKYSAYVEKIQCYPEVGVRVLIGKIAREVTKYKKGINVLVCWTKEHYYRVHVEVKKGSSYVKKTLDRIGYLFYCRSCYFMNWKNLVEASTNDIKCRCGKGMRIIGPLWIGELHTKDIVKTMQEKINKFKFEKETKKEIENLLGRIYNEINTPFYYNLHKLAAVAGVSCPSISRVIEMLEKEGFKASRCRFDGNGIKTNAAAIEIVDLMKKHF